MQVNTLNFSHRLRDGTITVIQNVYFHGDYILVLFTSSHSGGGPSGVGGDLYRLLINKRYKNISDKSFSDVFHVSYGNPIFTKHAIEHKFTPCGIVKYPKGLMFNIDNHPFSVIARFKSNSPSYDNFDNIFTCSTFHTKCIYSNGFMYNYSHNQLIIYDLEFNEIFRKKSEKRPARVFLVKSSGGSPNVFIEYNNKIWYCSPFEKEENQKEENQKEEQKEEQKELTNIKIHIMKNEVVFVGETENGNVIFFRMHDNSEIRLFNKYYQYYRGLLYVSQAGYYIIHVYKSYYESDIICYDSKIRKKIYYYKWLLGKQLGIAKDMTNYIISCFYDTYYLHNL